MKIVSEKIVVTYKGECVTDVQLREQFRLCEVASGLKITDAAARFSVMLEKYDRYTSGVHQKIYGR